MGTTADKLEYLDGTKSAIKQAIVNKGVAVPDGTTFRGYAGKIAEISGGGGKINVTTNRNMYYQNNRAQQYVGVPLDSSSTVSCDLGSYVLFNRASKYIHIYERTIEVTDNYFMFECGTLYNPSTFEQTTYTLIFIPDYSGSAPEYLVIVGN